MSIFLKYNIGIYNYKVLTLIISSLYLPIINGINYKLNKYFKLLKIKTISYAVIIKMFNKVSSY